jgi:hypothetical protein
MVLSATTALVDGGHAYRRLRRFSLALNGIVTLTLVALVATPAWGALATVLRLPEPVAELARVGVALLAPWPGAIGYRRFHQGLLIRAERTRPVVLGTIIRLVAMVSTVSSLLAFTEVPGAWVGTAALSAGVCAEALAARAMARAEVSRLAVESDDRTPLGRRLTYGRIASFYVPLAATSVLGLAVQPMLTFFMGRARDPLESLAVLPVVNALTFVFRAAGLSYQEVAITLLGRRTRPTGPVLRFGAMLAVGSSAALVAIAWTPLATAWYGTVSGLSRELIPFAVDPTRILSVFPALSVLLSTQRALLVEARRTVPITWATALELLGVAACLVGTVHGLHWTGATAAATALLSGRLAANVWLLPPCLRELRRPRTS